MEVGEHLALPSTFRAKDLPRTALSDHIEQRLFSKLKVERDARAKKSGEGIDKVSQIVLGYDSLCYLCFVGTGLIYVSDFSS